MSLDAVFQAVRTLNTHIIASKTASLAFTTPRNP